MFEKEIESANENLEGYISPTEKVKQVYTCNEIQEILNVSRTTVYQLLESHVFHYVRVGGRYRISRKSFEKWLNGTDGDSNE